MLMWAPGAPRRAALSLCLLAALCLQTCRATGLPPLAPVQPRNSKACDGVRCKELVGLSKPVCGVWKGDPFWFHNECDMIWFGCISERDYVTVSPEQCGERPSPWDPTKPSSSSHAPTKPATTTSTAIISTITTTTTTTTSTPTPTTVTSSASTTMNWTQPNGGANQPTLFSLTYPTQASIALPSSMPQFTFPTNPPPPTLPAITFPPADLRAQSNAQTQTPPPLMAYLMHSVSPLENAGADQAMEASSPRTSERK